MCGEGSLSSACVSTTSGIMSCSMRTESSVQKTRPHEIKTKMQFEEKEKGMNYLGEHELYYDEGKKEYMVKLVTNTEQMSMFDDEFNRGGVDDGL